MTALRLGLPDLMFVGPMGAGKTTAAEFLVKEFGYARIPIAGEHPGGIRSVAKLLFGDDAAHDRELLNRLACIDDEFPGVWVEAWERYVDTDPQGSMDRSGSRWLPSPIVVDDVRRDLEYYALRGRGFVTVRVIADEDDRVVRLKTSGKWQNEEQLDGRWEQWWPTAPFDHAIVNDGSPDEFYDDVIDVLLRERKRR